MLKLFKIEYMRRLFYVDDDFDDIETFVTAVKGIEKEGYPNKVELNVYSDGETLLNAIRVIKPVEGILFLDINMPLRSGFDILAEIRKDSDINKLPVIMYSTTSDIRAINTSHDLGANLYAVKPYTLKEISNLIKYVLEINWEGFIADRKDFIIKKNFL
jgi:DNA-binding response OmpR family regulator